jgi:hypothetical protein
MWIHLDNASVEIPRKLVNESQILQDALSVTSSSVKRKVTLPVPKEWLQAWAVCYCSEEDSLNAKDTKDLVHCLLVCFLSWIAALVVLTTASPIVTMFTACRARR